MTLIGYEPAQPLFSCRLPLFSDSCERPQLAGNGRPTQTCEWQELLRSSHTIWRSERLHLGENNSAPWRTIFPKSEASPPSPPTRPPAPERY